MNHRSILAGALAAAFALTAAGAHAQTFSRAETNGAPTTMPPRGACGTITLTQSTSQTITPLNSVSCNTASVHADNSYFRSFAITEDIDVCEIQFGIEEAAAGTDGTQPVTVNLYAGTGDFPATFPAGYTQIGTAALSVADQTATIFPASLAASVTAGSNLVVEINTPDGDAAGNTFFIGSNADGESAPGYIESADCAIDEPTPLADIGFGDMNIVLNVVGNPAGGGGGPDPVATPLPSSDTWSKIVLASLALVIGAFGLRRRARR